MTRERPKDEPNSLLCDLQHRPARQRSARLSVRAAERPPSLRSPETSRLCVRGAAATHPAQRSLTLAFTRGRTCSSQFWWQPYYLLSQPRSTRRRIQYGSARNKRPQHSTLTAIASTGAAKPLTSASCARR